MTNEAERSDETAAGLSPEQRAEAFGAAKPTIDRAAALRAGRTPVSPKFILWIVIAFAVLGIGGAILEHYYGNVGLPTTNTTPSTLPVTPTTPNGPQLGSSMSSFLDLKEIGRAQAPTFTLHDQSDRKWSLTSARGRVVVLTFYNRNCNDICPVLGAEIDQARTLLGNSAGKVDFIVVNTDPNHFGVTALPPALNVPHLLGSTEVKFLTGALSQLKPVWVDYGVQIKVGIKASEVAHNNVMYFIDPSGRLRSQVTPFGNENNADVFSLNPTDLRRFARGISQIAGSLVR
jgi:protein SCO1/2